MAHYHIAPVRGKYARQGTPAAAVSLKSNLLGAVPVGDNASLEVEVGSSGGATVLTFRNTMRQGRAGMCPAGPGALIGLDRVDDLILLLQQARAS
jgi:hypothetical protein